MAEVGAISIGLSADLRALVASLRDGEKKIEGYGQRVGRVVNDISGRLGALSSLKIGLAAGIGSELVRQLEPTKVIAAIAAINAEIAKMGETAKRLSLDTDTFQSLRYAATLSGVTDSAFTGGLESLSSKLAEAKRNEGEFGKLMQANNVAIVDRAGKLIDVNTALGKVADLIRRAGSEADKIKIAELAGLSKEWIRALEGGGQAFGRVAAGARDAGVIISQATIEKAQAFDREWTKATTQWSTRFKSGIAEILPLLDQLVNKSFGLMDAIGGKAGQLVIASKLTEGVTLSVNELSAAIALARAKGSPVDPSWLRELEKLQERQREFNRGLRAGAAPQDADTSSPAGPTTVIPREDTAFDKAQDQIRKRIELLKADTAAVGLNEVARDRLRVVAELEVAAQKAAEDAGRKGAEVSKEQRAAINQLADAYGKQATKLDELQRRQRGVMAAQQQFADSFMDVFDKAVLNGEKLDDVLRDLTKSLAKLVVQSALFGQGSLSGVMGTASSTTGGLGGAFGALFSSLFGKADGGIIKAAGGGAVSGPGTGRSDSIMARLSDGEYVVNARSTAKYRPIIEAINSDRLLSRMNGGVVGFSGGGAATAQLSAASRSSSSRPNINLINNSGVAMAKPKVTPRGNGYDIELQRMVVTAVASAIRQGDSDINSAQEQVYGSRRI